MKKLTLILALAAFAFSPLMVASAEPGKASTVTANITTSITRVESITTRLDLGGWGHFMGRAK